MDTLTFVIAFPAGIALGYVLHIYIAHVRSPLKYEVVEWVPGKTQLVPYPIKSFTSERRARRYANRKTKGSLFLYTVEDLEV